MAHRIIASWTEDRGRRKKSFAVAFVNYTTGVNDSLMHGLINKIVYFAKNW